MSQLNLSKEIQLTICKYRIDGDSIYKISEKTGLSSQTVLDFLRTLSDKKVKCSERVVYVNIETWMFDHKTNMTRLCEELGVTRYIIIRFLYGQKPLTRNFLYDLQKLMNLSIEQILEVNPGLTNDQKELYYLIDNSCIKKIMQTHQWTFADAARISGYPLEKTYLALTYRTSRRFPPPSCLADISAALSLQSNKISKNTN